MFSFYIPWKLQKTKDLARNELDKYVHCHRYLVNVESYQFQNSKTFESYRVSENTTFIEQEN